MASGEGDISLPAEQRSRPEPGAVGAVRDTGSPGHHRGNQGLLHWHRGKRHQAECQAQREPGEVQGTVGDSRRGVDHGSQVGGRDGGVGTVGVNLNHYD